ncbi:MAG TPA: hypothetical protein IAA17_01220 [Candidatus Lachnoclostridium stercorigallinarum]|uniref:Uncharacterized protein n=1 Tax=Candidatus Lachnoclostridium stercorigallinarum TaxID=2838634 RepID=A0A9D2GGE6_9FIRM|nr:hypothetical protein [Candidatus Lachnoclostridium stercorigallinarum]
MVALRIGDIRGFTSRLFVRETFDHMLVREARVVTYNSFTIDGRIRPGFYTKDELEAGDIGEYSSWKVIRPLCFALIKGKKLPGSFQIEFAASPEMTERFVSEAGGSWRPEMIKGLYLGVRYENGGLLCVTGMSMAVFTLDRSLEQMWDDAVKAFLKKNEIIYSEE